jgi:hypothetical protein
MEKSDGRLNQHGQHTAIGQIAWVGTDGMKSIWDDFLIFTRCLLAKSHVYPVIAYQLSRAS